MVFARAQGRGYEFVDAFLKCVWSQGVNAGTEKGQRKIVEMSGLDWREALPFTDRKEWRAEAEANRQEMMSLGSWGVPSFKNWRHDLLGQDRLWLVEDALKKITKKS